MLSHNKTLKHFFLNPIHLEMQDAIDVIDSCRTNNTLELLSLVQWPPKFDDKRRDPFHYLHDPEITHILQQIQPCLNVYWLVYTYYCSYKSMCCYLLYREYDEYEKIKEKILSQ